MAASRMATRMASMLDCCQLDLVVARTDLIGVDEPCPHDSLASGGLPLVAGGVEFVGGLDLGGQESAVHMGDKISLGDRPAGLAKE